MMGKEIYCNWHKGPHQNQCANPSQCYCSCHLPIRQTNYNIAKQITYHENRIAELKHVLESRRQ